MRVLKSLGWLLVLVLAATSATTAARTRSKKSTKTKTAKVVKAPKVPKATLKGSPGTIERANKRADQESISKIRTAVEMKRFKASGLLVPLPETSHVKVDPEELDIQWRWARPWVKEFLESFGADYYTEFGEAVVVTSAVRTVGRQLELQQGTKDEAPNGNAGQVDGPRASPHLRGIAVDVTYKPNDKFLTAKQVRWIKDYLLKLERKGLIDATIEKNQAVFHIVVFRPKVEKKR